MIPDGLAPGTGRPNAFISRPKLMLASVACACRDVRDQEASLVRAKTGQTSWNGSDSCKISMTLRVVDQLKAMLSARHPLRLANQATRRVTAWPKVMRSRTHGVWATEYVQSHVARTAHIDRAGINVSCTLRGLSIYFTPHSETAFTGSASLVLTLVAPIGGIWPCPWVQSSSQYTPSRYRRRS